MLLAGRPYKLRVQQYLRGSGSESDTLAKELAHLADVRILLCSFGEGIELGI